MYLVRINTDTTVTTMQVDAASIFEACVQALDGFGNYVYVVLENKETGEYEKLTPEDVSQLKLFASDSSQPEVAEESPKTVEQPAKRKARASESQDDSQTNSDDPE